MPFCTECGARHAEGAKVCPNCGEPIFEAPTDEDLNDVVASLDQNVTLGDELPEIDAEPGEPSADYMDQIDMVRAQIAAQSTSLQTLTELNWSNPQAARIRDELGQALGRLHSLRPPDALAGGHADFVEGAELLADGFNRLVEASERGNAEAAVAEAEMAIAEATNRFLRGADALNEYFTLQEAGLADDLPLPPVPELEQENEADDEELPELPPIDEVEPEEEEEDLPNEEEIPPPPSLEDLDLALADLPQEIPTPAPAFLSEPMPEPPPMPDYDYAADAQAGAWAGLGDPATDTLLSEIESAWVRSRPQVHEAIERAIRAAVLDALRSSLGTRLRIEQDARATLDRIAADRNRMLDEVEALRRENHSLQTEKAELQRSLTELERERQIALDRRKQIFADAETQRTQLLREIEQLSGQLGTMRQNVVNLLNMSAGVSGQLAAMGSGTPAPASPMAPAPSPGPAVAASPAASTRTAPPPMPVAPARRAPAPAPAAPTSTEVRIAGVTSLGKNLQIQQAIKSLSGVTVEGQPRYRNGVITATLRHAADFDVADALEALPEQPLSLTGSPEPGVLELAAT